MELVSRRILRALLRCPLTIDDLAGELGAERASVAGSINAMRPRGLVRATTTRKPYRWTPTPAGVTAAHGRPGEQLSL